MRFDLLTIAAGTGPTGMPPAPGWIAIAVVIGVAAVGALLRFLAKYYEWRGSVDTKLSTIEPFMAEIREKFDQIIRGLDRKVIESRSPRQLTDFGNEIAVKVRAFEWATSEAPTHVNDLRGQLPFQIDQFSHAHVHADVYDKMNEEWQNRVDSCAYEFGITRDAVLDVLYVALRDELLKALGLPVADD